MTRILHASHRGARRLSAAAILAAASFLPLAAIADRLPIASVNDTCALIAQRLHSVSLEDCTQVGLRAATTASVEGLPILYRDYLPADADATEVLRVLLIGGIHGDELSSVSILFRFIAQLDQGHARDLHWRVVPALNPDGLLRRPAQRVNARGVDLNRNFPSPDWQRAALPYWARRTGSDPRRYPGPDALSEPESRWLAAQILEFEPDVVVSMHAPLGLLDFDGAAPPPERLGFLRLRRLGTYPGSLGDWAGAALRITVLTPELPYAGIMPSRADILGLWTDLVDWLRARARPQTDGPLRSKLLDDGDDDTNPAQRLRAVVEPFRR